jgi:hypothetical protein
VSVLRVVENVDLDLLAPVFLANGVSRVEEWEEIDLGIFENAETRRIIEEFAVETCGGEVGVEFGGHEVVDAKRRQ